MKMNFRSLLLSFHIQDLKAERLARLCFNDELKAQKLLELKADLRAEELFYVNTCNRVEFLFLFKEQNYSENYQSHPLFSEHIEMARVLQNDNDIIAHLLNVALSMDSLVFGETQIMGQLKLAEDFCLQNSICGKYLNRLINFALKEARFIRQSHKLSAYHNSVSTVAAKFISKQIDANENILLVGAGETNQLVASYLKKRSFPNLFWTNRTYEKALKQSRNPDYAIKWEEYKNVQSPKTQFSAIVLATNAGEFILQEKHLTHFRPRIVVDLSVPANANKNDVLSKGIIYLGVEDLQGLLNEEKTKTLQLRNLLQQEIKNACKRILRDFKIVLNDDELAKMAQESQNIFVKHFQEQLPKELESLPESEQKVLQEWSRRLAKKLTHAHLEQLKAVILKYGNNSEN